MSLTARHPEMALEMGKYHLIGELARGGMGNVYLAALCGAGGFNKLLVLKELKPELAEDETYVTMFLEEARLAARLIHPNIVQTNEVCSEDHRHYMTMEFLDGRSLSRIVKRLGPSGAFPVGAQLRVLTEALHGLHYAHELRGFDGEPLGIVHRDVSPLNVMVTFDGQAKLLDFGIAKAVDSSLETQAGVLKGRIAYMAPEQAVGVKVDRRADIYSIGVLIWEAVAGRRLWPEMSEVEILSRLLGEGPPRLRDVAPGVPEELDAMCARAMARDANERYTTATELLEDLEGHIAHRDDRMTMRQIGEIVRGAFAEERQRTAQVIEETIARVGRGPGSGVMRSLRSSLGGTPVRGGESGSLSGAIALTLDAGSLPAIRLEGSASKSPLRGAAASLHAAAPGIGGVPFATPDQAPRPRFTVLRAAAVFVLLLVVGALLVFVRAGRTPGPAPTAATAALPAASPIATSIATASVPGPGPKTPEMANPTAAAAQPTTRGETHETARPTFVPSRTHISTNVSPPSPGPVAPGAPPPAAAPQAVPSESAHETKRTPTVSCDPPFTVDANGIEHFKAGCL